MTTKELLEDKARVLFNEKGIMNVTLRDVASAMERSYGNITYYYSTKEKLIRALFKNFTNELSSLKHDLDPSENLLIYFLRLPDLNYNISLRYLFFSLDFVELKRNYPTFFEEAAQLNSKRQKDWLMLFSRLQDLNYLKANLTHDDLNFIMSLSAAVRTFYFQQHNISTYRKAEYSSNLNRMLLPYLSKEGRKIYNSLFNC